MIKINMYILTLMACSFFNLFESTTLFGAELNEQDRRRNISTQQEKAKLFHELHREKPLFLLNAWDAVSAKIFEERGAKAIATTSAGIAAVFGYPDGQQIPRELLVTMVDRIVKSVKIPVTVDLEAGFGETLEEICETTQKILETGAVGINIEDADPKNPGHLIEIAEQVRKIRSIKDLAKSQDVPLFINARTDIFWLNILPQETRLEETLIRLSAYKEAGADGIFIPGLTDPGLIAAITSTIGLPLNVLAGPWIENEEMLNNIGIARLTIGSAGIRTALGHVRDCAKLYIENRDCGSFMPSISYNELNQLLSSSASST